MHALKELSNVAYSLSKQSKDVTAQLRWAQQTMDRVHGNMEIKETMEGIQKELETAQAEQAGGAFPAGDHPTHGQAQGQWNAGHPRKAMDPRLRRQRPWGPRR